MHRAVQRKTAMGKRRGEPDACGGNRLYASEAARLHHAVGCMQQHDCRPLESPGGNSQNRRWAGEQRAFCVFGGHRPCATSPNLSDDDTGHWASPIPIFHYRIADPCFLTDNRSLTPASAVHSGRVANRCAFDRVCKRRLFSINIHLDHPQHVDDPRGPSQRAHPPACSSRGFANSFGVLGQLQSILAYPSSFAE